MKDNNALPRWAEMANDYLSAGLDYQTAVRWQNEMKNSVPSVTSRDVSNAIIANKGRNLRRKVTVADLISWLKEDLPPADRSLKSCNFCIKGWLEHAPDLKDDFTLDDYSKAYRDVVPCLCSSGGHHVNTKVPAENHASLQAPRSAARRQRMRYNKLCAQIDIKALKVEIAKNGDVLKKVEVE